MRILLDECVPSRLVQELAGHEVRTVPQMGWASNENGALLTLSEGKFDVFLTTDQRISRSHFRIPLPQGDSGH